MRKGIKNIIFDMGRVIIDFVPEIFMDRSGIDKEFPVMDTDGYGRAR